LLIQESITTMKKIALFIILIQTGYLAKSQRFFYVEPGNNAEQSIEKKLLQTSQYVTKSAIESDYIIKTEAGYQSKSNLPIVKIILVDSITLKPLFEAQEDYASSLLQAKPANGLNLAIRTLIEKNIGQIILTAKDNRFHTLVKMVHAKKDKT
jgi:hypothetical protein